MLKNIDQKQVDEAIEVCQEQRNINWFNTIAWEIVPWLEGSPPIYKSGTVEATLMNEVHWTTTRNLQRTEIDEGYWVWMDEDGREVDEPEEETFIRIQVWDSFTDVTVDVREDAESRRKGSFFCDSLNDDFDFNLGGISTSKRGPIHSIAHVYRNRGSSWGVPKHCCPKMGFALYLGYQLSHQIKTNQTRKG